LRNKHLGWKVLLSRYLRRIPITPIRLVSVPAIG
jgi:hypothetical protein